MYTMYPGINGSPERQLTSAITTTSTAIPLSATSHLPAAPNIATIGTTSTAEVVLYTGKTSTSLTGCTRGFGGTIASGWPSGTSVYRAFTKYDHDALLNNISELNGAKNYWLYNGRDLSTIFTAAQLIAAVRADDWSNIRIGDYWPITLSGTYRDYSSYTCPANTNYYSDTGLSSLVGSAGQAYEAAYVNTTYCSIVISSTTYYVSTAACLDYYARTLSNAVFKLEVVAISPFMNYGDTPLTSPHMVLVSRDCTPHVYKMRKADTAWTDGAATNPWLGSALYKTLNEATYGILPLVAATDIGAYIHAGTSGSTGLRFYGEIKASGASTSTAVAAISRGKLFVPTEAEVVSSARMSEAYGTLSQTQFPLFSFSSRHRFKGLGDGGSRSAWWTMSSMAGSATAFVYVSASAGHYVNTASIAASVPICFVVA